MFSQSRPLKTFLALAISIVLLTINVQPVHAGAPWPPELVSPSNNSQGDGNPPQLCAKNMGDPEGDPVQIRFEVWGGSEADHISPWMDAGGTGNIVCWRDSAPWTTETHSWAARAMDNHGEQSGGSPDWKVQIPSSPTPVPTCTVDNLNVSPPAPQPVGTVLFIYASASCSNGVSSLRFSVDGGVIGTVSGASGTVNWNTTGAAATAHTITVEAADGTGVIRKSRSTNYDLTSGAPPPTPDVNCSITSFNFYPSSPQPPGTSVQISSSASCNTGVRAIRLRIGGGIVNEFAGPSTSWTWNTSGLTTRNYQITVEAAGQGDNSWSQAASQTETYRLEQSAPTIAPVANSFSTGDVIQIGYDVYVIINGQRRLVPNPETLDALGISRSWINNKGFSDSDLLTIPRGSDVPDVNRDWAGFNAFKQTYFPNTVPIIPSFPTPTPTSISIGKTATPIPPPTEHQVDQVESAQPVSNAILIQRALPIGTNICNPTCGDENWIEFVIPQGHISESLRLNTLLPFPISLIAQNSKAMESELQGSDIVIKMGLSHNTIMLVTLNGLLKSTIEKLRDRNSWWLSYKITTNGASVGCDVTAITYLTPPITCEESIVDIVTTIGLSIACVSLDSNPLGYFMTHTIYRGWILTDANGVVSDGWFYDKQIRKTVSGPAIIVEEANYLECGIPGNP